MDMKAILRGTSVWTVHCFILGMIVIFVTARTQYEVLIYFGKEFEYILKKWHWNIDTLYKEADTLLRR